ncbi:putative CobQ/CobB/MinD/ParA nucleotide binding domain-containing protein [Candidatus Terasakiella magnetica]|uniref:Putative CobQ/CobB/MinD/ParA nucleotide binding domain-containing protein n=1 Tax=Candidatus Terasakiella magnetica TaxID=1867952 RepID=A0A1C3RET2_9PROT|nr:AAA family ATPase [Candidatus Terasakiella magnetica]SCA55714.1 putative CobQ/CobB/MinD/ParA nucleotide binding domain-containing protein [Candidatus Terasakiella magnetica]
MSALMEHNDQHQQEPFMAFVQDDITTHSLNDVVSLQGWNTNRIFDGGIDLAIKTLSEIDTPQLLVIDLTGCMAPLEKIAELASVCEAGVGLVCLGTTNDVSLYRDLLDMGVEDYLLKPIDPETLAHAIERACEVEEAPIVPEDECEGDVVSVFGALGGVGATATALNLAWDISEREGKRVALVDMDLHFGTIALSLDLEPGKGFREALENPSRIDSLFLERAMVKVSERFSILACETDLATVCHFESEALDLLIERLRQKYDLVVLDVPRDLLPRCGDLLSRLGKMIVVSDLSLAGMRDSLRMTRYAKDHMIEDNLMVCASRAGENKERELSVKEFEKGIEKTLSCTIPYDAKGFAAAEMQGSALMKVAPKSKAAQAMESLFSNFVEKGADEVEKTSFWRKIFKAK